MVSKNLIAIFLGFTKKKRDSNHFVPTKGESLVTINMDVLIIYTIKK